jgi:hypothetical protein
MRGFVIGISDYSKAIKPNFFIIPQILWKGAVQIVALLILNASKVLENIYLQP